MTDKEAVPPRSAQRLLSLFLTRESRSSILSDFAEIFEQLGAEAGRSRAVRWYWRQVITSVPMFCKNLLYWSIVMLKNYFKVVVRNILKNKVYSSIVIVGFAIGLACFLLIAVWVQNELSYDDFLAGSGLIYKVDADAQFNNRDLSLGTQTNYTGPVLEKDLPEVEKHIRLYQPFETSVVKNGPAEIFRENGVVYTDQNFFEFFDFPLQQGNRKQALNDPTAVVISTETAEKYFPGRNPLGKTLIINENAHHVTGVIDIAGLNSHINFDFLVVLPPFSFKADEFRNLNLAYFTYVRLQERTDVGFLQKKMTVLVKQYFKPVTDALGMKNFRYNVILRPLAGVYLHSNLSVRENFRSGSITNIYIVLAVAIIILFIVSFNYMNLTLARSLVRTTEIGIRRIVGADRSKIRRQLLGETSIQTFIAFLMAIIIAGMLSPLFNQITGKNVNLIQSTFRILPLLILVVVLVILLSGLYPALYLSKITPVKLIRSDFFSGQSRIIFRKFIVIAQFTLSIILIIATLFIAKQIDYMKNEELGFSGKNRMVLNLANSQYEKKSAILKRALEEIKGVESVAVSSSVPGKFSGQNPFSIQGDSAIHFFWMYFVDHDFLPAYGLKLVEGRNISADRIADRNQSAVINEAAVRRLGLTQPVGAMIEDQTDKSTYEVIGVIKDFHNESLHGEIKPIIFRSILRDNPATYMKPQFMTLLIHDETIPGTMAAVEKAFGRLIPHQVYEYFFINDLYDSFYEGDAHFHRIFIYSSGLAILLSCLGLFGLSTFIAQRKTKEIGIRKVLGASFSRVLFIISREFIKWVVLANIIAWPIAYYAVNRWLQQYAYRTSADILTFLFSGLLALTLALMTIGFQTARVAGANPVEALKYE